MESSSIEIKLKRMDRVYRLSEKVEGVVIVNAYKGWNHTGVNVSIEGTIVLSHAGQTVGSLSDSGAKLITIMKKEASICAAGKFNEGATELPFEVVLSPLKGHNLLESYHGMYISIVYNIQVSCERGMLKKALRKEIEFIVETTSLNYTAEPNPIVFSVTPESLENISASVVATIPKFKITGKLHKSTCPVNRPLTGEVIIEKSDAAIRSLELQLVRVETVEMDGATTKEATEVQNIQIGEGNICRNVVVPMYMVFPRLFSCPSVNYISTEKLTFKIEFEVNLVLVFGDGYMITENFPLTLYRDE